MITPRKTAAVILASAFLTTGAFAVPNSTPDPIAKCSYDAMMQYQLDLAFCRSTYPPQAGQLLSQCETQATLKWASANAACANKTAGARTSMGPKSILDPAFTRRLRN